MNLRGGIVVILLILPALLILGVWQRTRNLRAVSRQGGVDLLPPSPLHEMPRVMHYTFGPLLTPFFIAVLDAGVKAVIPDETIYLHLTIPENSPEEFIQRTKAMTEYQLGPILNNLNRSGNLDKFKIIYHEGVVETLIAGTPLEGIGIQNRNLLGYWTEDEELRSLSPNHPRERGSPFFYREYKGVPHAMDALRVLILYKYGGTYVDADVFLLKDLTQVSRAFGSIILCENRLQPSANVGCIVVNAIMALTRRHPYTEDLLRVIRRRVLEFGAVGVFPGSDPIGPTVAANAPWLSVGPKSLTSVMRNWGRRGWAKYFRGIPHASTSGEILPAKIEEMQDPAYIMEASETVKSVEPRDYVTLFGREFLSPTHWAENHASEPTDVEWAEKLAKTYTVHLWDQAAPENELGKPRQNMLVYLKDRPDTLVSYLHRTSCLAFCDIDLLYSHGEADAVLAKFPIPYGRTREPKPPERGEVD